MLKKDSGMAQSEESRGQGRRPVIIGNQNERAMLYKIADSLAHLQNPRSLPSPGSDASRTSGTSTPKDGIRKGENYATATSTSAALEEIKKSLQTFKKDDHKPSELEAPVKVNVQALIDQMNPGLHLAPDRPTSKFGGLAPSQTMSQKPNRPNSDDDMASSSTNTMTDNGAASPPPPLPPRPRVITSSPAPPLPPPRDAGPSRSAVQYQGGRRKEPPAVPPSNNSTPRGVSPAPPRLLQNGTPSNAPTATPPSTLEQLAKQTGYTTEEIQKIVLEHTMSRQTQPPQTIQPASSLPSYNDKHTPVPTGNGPPPNNYPKPPMNGMIAHPQPTMQQQLNPPPPYPSTGNYMPSPASSVTSGSSNDYLLMPHLCVDYRKAAPYGESPSSGSSSPASVHNYQSHYHANMYHHQYMPQPITAWETKQYAAVTQSVRSQPVARPSIQTATTPANTDHSQPPSYNSVHAQVSSSPKNRTFAQPKPVTTNGSHTPTGNSVHIKIRNHQDPQMQVKGNPNFHVSASHAQHPQPGIPIQLESNRQSIQIQFSTPISNPVVDPHVHRKGSTETRSDSPVSRTTNQSPLSVLSTTSTNSDLHPPPPYPGPSRPPTHNFPHMQTPDSSELSETEQSETDSIVSTDTTRCTSPIPKLKPDADKARDDDKHWSKLRNYSPAAFKFYMEQHIENVLKQHRERIKRRVQLENELDKIQGMSEEARQGMRALLHKKESNYLRLRRAKLNPTMFEVIKKLGVGAFGEVTLVRKKGVYPEGASSDADTPSDSQKLYAMKTLRKVDVIRRNQVAHVKAERDMLAEAELEWVTKLYYSFQDKENLYFIMEYIPGGDLMALLIKKGIFDEPMSRFFIAELVLAIESVHNMGFIHRDIKPDNILIDANGHIKLTDFGLCTGFRWTHNSKYYQEGHNRQDSMDISDSVDPCNCPKELPKILEKRRRKEKQRCTAHSLVGTPNYIAPEVLLRQGYTKTCDWWSVGVILYEMLVGQPPFLANSPKDTQIKVVNWEKYLRIPEESNLTKHASSLIVQLCTSAERRLGKNGAAEIKSHPFFKSVDFASIRKTRPPYKPVIRYPTDTSNFDDVEEHDTQPPYKVDDLRQNGQFPEHAFSEFTFRRFFDDGGLNAKLTDCLSSDLNQMSINSSEPTASSSTHQTSTSSQNDRTPQNSYVEEETRAGNPVYV